MKVYVVGDYGPEHNNVKGIYKTYDSALKAWNKLRISFLEKAKHCAKTNKEDSEMYQKIVENLSCEDPKKINNHSQETPYIKEWEVQE